MAAQCIQWQLDDFQTQRQKRHGCHERNWCVPNFSEILCHDHWKPYYKYDCTLALCNAHDLGELTRAWEQDGQKWAQQMKEVFETINQKVNEAGGLLDAKNIKNIGKNTGN